MAGLTFFRTLLRRRKRRLPKLSHNINVAEGHKLDQDISTL